MPPSILIVAAASGASSLFVAILSWAFLAGVVLDHVSTPAVVVPIVGNTTCDASVQFQGTWDGNTSYPATTVVLHNASSYIALCGENEGVEPGTDEAVWQLMASGGQDGTDGANGINGTTALTWRGDWEEDVTDYVAFDLVYYSGSSYIAVDDSITPGDPPPDDFLHWNILALQGQGLTFLGAWNNSYAFASYDVVTYLGGAYVSILTGSNHLPTDTTYWTLLASKGDSGLGLTHRGAWSSLTAYVINDIVSQSGSSYVCTVAHTNLSPVSNPSHWGVSASKGDAGGAGAAGPAGQSFTWLGDWDSGTAYIAYDVVSSDGTMYVCTGANTNQVPPNVLYWDVSASKGDDGTAGLMGQGFDWLGAWDSGTSYVAYDVVSSGGSIYVCTAPNTNQVPPNVLYWSVGATKGAGYGGTSTTSANLEDDYSDNSFVLSPGEYAYVPGTRVRATAGPAEDENYMEGLVTLYTASTFTLAMQPSYSTYAGSGPYTSWTFSVAGEYSPPGQDGYGYGGTSASSETLGSSGSKSFTIQDSNYAYQAGLRVRAYHDATHYMEGVVTSTGSGPSTVTFTADYAVGSGTFVSWTLGIAGEIGPAGSGYGGTSTSSQTIGNSGTKTFDLVATSNYAYNTGMRVRAYNSAGNYMEGVVVSYTPYTLVFTADHAVGSGTYTSWTIGIAGEITVGTEYNVAGSFTYFIPSTAKFLEILFCGAGGGGGAGNNAGSFGGGGGGGGGTCRFETIPVAGATTATVDIGGGGAGGATAQADGIGTGGPTSLTMNSFTISAYGGGSGGGPSSATQSGGGGGSAGSIAGGNTLTDVAGSGGSGSSDANLYYSINVAGNAGGAGVAANGAGSDGISPQSSARNALYWLGGGGGGGSTVNSNAGNGGSSQTLRTTVGVRGAAHASNGGGGGGGNSGLGIGGNGGSNAAGAATVGTKGSGGGGGRGGTGSTWGVGANGGPGYMYIRPV